MADNNTHGHNAALLAVGALGGIALGYLAATSTQTSPSHDSAPDPKEATTVEDPADAETEWLVARRTLNNWTRSRLIAFNEKHLGAGCWSKDSILALRAAAAAVIDAKIEAQGLSALQGSNEQLIQVLRHLLQTRQVPNNVVQLPTPKAALPEQGTAMKMQEQITSGWDVPRAAFTRSKSSKKDHPKVIFSYQNQQEKFMAKLRSWLNERGIDTVDGSQVPPGSDWRVFYFTALREAEILLPILSKSFLFSRPCESELTYSAEKSKKIIPILCDPAYMTVLQQPQDYVEYDEDIELRAPKMEAILCTANRIPGNGPFEDNFEANAEELLKLIEENLSHVRRDSVDNKAANKLERAESQTFTDLEGPIKSVVEALNACPPPSDDVLLRTLHEVNMRLYDPAADALDLVACEAAIQAEPAASLVALLGSEDPEIQSAAAECLKNLCVVGGPFGGGVLNFRKTAVEEEAIERLLELISQENQSRTLHHRAIMAINYLTRASQGKKVLAAADGVQIVLKLTGEADCTSQGRSVALAILWNMVYDNENKRTMITHGILETVKAYSQHPHCNTEGMKCCYFLCSHLAYLFAEQVYLSGIVDHALNAMAQCSSLSQFGHSHKAEGACRLLHTIAMMEETRSLLAGRAGTMETLFYVLFDLHEGRAGMMDDNLCASATMDKEGPPKDAFKMRAASALDWLSRLPAVADSVSMHLDELMSSGKADEHSLVWLATQPVLNGLLLQVPGFVNYFHQKLLAQYSHDIVILLIAFISDWKELETLLDRKTMVTHSSQDVSVVTVGEFLLHIFDDSALSMCSQWASLCQSLRLSGLAQSIVAEFQEGIFVPELVRCLVVWLQCGHPYKIEAKLVLDILIQNPTLQIVAGAQVHKALELLSPATLALESHTMLNSIAETAEAQECNVRYLSAAFEEMTRQ